MKTLPTISLTIFATTTGSALIGFATGLPMMFALLAAVSAVALTFAATIVIGALVHPSRAPLSLADRRRAERVTVRPITRPARLAA